MSLTRQSVVAMAAAVRAGETRAADLVQAHLDRIAQVDGELNAFTLVDGEHALARAAGIDARVAAGEDPGPLAGVPVAVKDIIDQEGLPTTCGSSFYAAVAERSAPVVARLEAAGAVMIGRTGLHEWAFGFSSENHWWGPVRNPWDPATSPGGSSGGSAAAVAAGMSAAALGTDTGGSVRVPAALCGLVGLKVTHGRVPLTGVFPLAAGLDTVGPLARSVADAAALYTVMAGDDPSDPWSAPVPVTPPGRPADPAGLRVALPRQWLAVPTDTAIRDAFAQAMDRLAGLGAMVEEVDAPLLDPPGEMMAVFGPQMIAVHRQWFTAHPDRYGPETRDRIAGWGDVANDDHVAGLRWQAALRHQAARLLSRYDVLATPMVPATRKVIGEDRMAVAGESHQYRAVLATFSSLVNATGFPALALPLAAAGDPPPSLQLVGPPWSEHRLLEAGAALEETGIAAFRPPPRW